MSIEVKKKSLYILLIVISAILAGCNPSLNEGRKLNLKINLVKINAWINLMPGKETSFHISGTVNIKNNEENTLSDVHLRGIVITQGKDLVSQSKILFNSLSGENIIEPNSNLNFDFKASMNMNMMNNINRNNPIAIEFLFTSSGKNFNFKSDKIKIDKIY
jgi:hypothetical protein